VAQRNGLGGWSSVDCGGSETLVAQPQPRRHHCHDRTAVAGPLGRGALLLIANGESGKAGGNETIRVDEAGRLRIKTRPPWWARSVTTTTNGRGASPAGARCVTTSDFPSGHWPSRRGGRDRQTWPLLDDQASAGRAPQRTGAPPACGDGPLRAPTGQAKPSPKHHPRQVRPSGPTHPGAGPPENTHLNSCSPIRNG
jgi:hypothetical protein